VAHGHLAQAMVQWIGGGNLQETMGFWPQIQGDPADFHTNSGIMVTSPELRYDQPTSDSGTAPSSGLVNIKVGCCGSFHHRVKVFCFLDHGS